jgi:hypothetical protein
MAASSIRLRHWGVKSSSRSGIENLRRDVVGVRLAGMSNSLRRLCVGCVLASNSRSMWSIKQPACQCGIALSAAGMWHRVVSLEKSAVGGLGSTSSSVVGPDIVQYTSAVAQMFCTLNKK